MILILYATLMALALVLLILGYFFRIEVLTIVGYGFFFILNSAIMVNGIQYESGDFISRSGTNITVISQYSTYSAHYIGFFLAIIGVVGIFFMFLEYKSSRWGE